MPETEEVKTEIEQESTQVAPTLANPFQSESWAEQPVNSDTQTKEAVTVTETKQTEEKTEEHELVDANEFLKTNLGYDSLEVAKTEIEQLKKLKDQPAKEIEFANETSKKLFEYLKDGKEDDLYNFLNEKKKVERLSSLEVNDENAEDIIKFAMKQKYKDLNDKEIEYKFNRQFGLPKEPTIKDDELEEDFEARKAEWQEKVNEIKMERAIEAKLAKPEIEKLKSEIILPDIKKGEEKTQEMSQEELDKLRQSYLSELENEIVKFSGFDATYKNEGVEIPVAYGLTEEEKVSFKNRLQDFDPVDFVLKRWMNEDGSRNVLQLAKDVYELENNSKIHQKLVNEAGNKAIENYIKSKKNIDIRNNGVETVFNPTIDNKTEKDKLAEVMFQK